MRSRARQVLIVLLVAAFTPPTARANDLSRSTTARPHGGGPSLFVGNARPDSDLRPHRSEASDRRELRRAFADKYTFVGNNPTTWLDPTGEIVFIPALIALAKIMAVGAVVGGGFEATRQGIQMAEGSRQEFSFGDVGRSAGLGALAAPLLVAAPELIVPLAGLGIASGVTEMSQGNYATGAFDIATAVLPFGSRGVRQSIRGGPMTKHFYRGTTAYEAEEAAQAGLNVAKVIRRQTSAEAPPHRGPGLYFTEQLHPQVEGSASYWGGFHSGPGGRAGGPAVLEASMSRFRWWGFRRRPGVMTGAEQPGFKGPSTLETFIPEALAPAFARGATWRALPWPIPTGPNLAPLIFGPQVNRLWQD